MSVIVLFLFIDWMCESHEVGYSEATYILDDKPK